MFEKIDSIPGLKLCMIKKFVGKALYRQSLTRMDDHKKIEDSTLKTQLIQITIKMIPK